MHDRIQRARDQIVRDDYVHAAVRLLTALPQLPHIGFIILQPVSIDACKDIIKNNAFGEWIIQYDAQTRMLTRYGTHRPVVIEGTRYTIHLHDDVTRRVYASGQDVAISGTVFRLQFVSDVDLLVEF